jgi:hypothetical protein
MYASPLPDVGIPVGSGAFDMAGRLLAFLVFGGAGVLLAVGVRDLLRHWERSAGPGLGKLVGRPRTPEWVTTQWLCGGCRSFNHQSVDRCHRCGRARSNAQLHPPPSVPPEDIIPAAIDVTGRRVSLDHNRAAHLDGLHSHWQLRVDGQVVGSASLRTGAVALLRCVEGTDMIWFDPHGSGHGQYNLGRLVAAFSAGRLPISEPCPESTFVPA